MDERTLTASTAGACRRHGAQRVYDAAHAAMAGSHGRLSAVGLPQTAGNLPALLLVARVAYDVMSDAEQADDLAGATIEAARIAR